MFYLLFFPLIVFSKKMVEINQYKLYSSSCSSFPDNTEKYDMQTCYMDTLMHDNYGLSIEFDYCSIDDEQVKMLFYDNKKCSSNNNMIVKYLESGYYKVNGGCYKFKCIEVNEEEDDNFFDGLIGTGIIIGIILYCCLPCIVVGICICLCVKICQQDNIINNHNIAPQPHIIIHNPDLHYPKQNIEMTKQTEGI